MTTYFRRSFFENQDARVCEIAIIDFDHRAIELEKSSIDVLSPRLFLISSPLAKKSKGFLFVASRFRSVKLRFKQTASSISRLTRLFEPRQICAVFCVQSKRATAASLRAGSTSPNWASASSALPASALSSWDLAW